MAEEIPCIDPYDRADNRSLWFKVGSAIKDMMLSVPENIRYLTLEELKREGDPTNIMVQIRFNLWKSYQERIANPSNKSAITIVELVRRSGDNVSQKIKEVSVQTTMHRHLDKANHYALAFLFCPLRNFEQTMEECMDIGLERLMEIMQLKFKDEDGKVDHKAAALVLKAYEMVEHRVRETHQSKINGRLLGPPTHELPPRSLEELENEVRALENEAKQKIIPPPITELPSMPMIDPVQYFRAGDHAGSKEEEKKTQDLIQGE